MKRAIVSPGFVKRTLAKLLKLDQQLGIVVDGNVASQAIAVGNYVNLINSTITGKTDGIYVATGAVSSGGTVTASDISGNALAKGISNELSDHIGNKADVICNHTDWSTTHTVTIDSSKRTFILSACTAGFFGHAITYTNGNMALYAIHGTAPTVTRNGTSYTFTFGTSTDFAIFGA